MSCFCSVPLGALLGALPRIPSLSGLLPPISANLTMAVNAAAAPGLGMSLAANMAANASMNAALVANLSALTSLSTALRAAFGMSLSTAMSPSLSAGLHANLSATINGFNANSGPLMSVADLIAQLIRDLMGLVNLSALVLAVRAAFGIDLRASGAIAALQARLALSGLAAANLSAQASLPAGPVAALMAALGFQVNASGALALNATAQATAGFLASLPTMTGAFLPLSLLAMLMSMLAAIEQALGVNLLAPSAMASLSVALSLLPLNGLAQLGANMSAAATASVSLSAALAASASLNAAAALNLGLVASANLAAAGPLAMLMQVTLQAKLGLPAGSCGGPCPLALLKGVPAMPSLAASGSV